MARRIAVIVLLALVGALVTACGGSSSTSSAGQPAASRSFNPEQGESSDQVAPGVPALDGASVPMEMDSYQYQVGPASAATTATTYVSGDLAEETEDAPPGTVYVLVWVKVTNAVADRPEPAPVFEALEYDVPPSLFGLAVPDAESQHFGDCTVAGTPGLSIAAGDGYCGLTASLTSASMIPEDDQIQASESVYLQLVAGPVPESVTLDDVQLFVHNCLEQGSACEEDQGVAEVPAAS